MPVREAAAPCMMLVRPGPQRRFSANARSRKTGEGSQAGWGLRGELEVTSCSRRARTLATPSQFRGVIFYGCAPTKQNQPLILANLAIRPIEGKILFSELANLIGGA